MVNPPAKPPVGPPAPSSPPPAGGAPSPPPAGGAASPPQVGGPPAPPYAGGAPLPLPARGAQPPQPSGGAPPPLHAVGTPPPPHAGGAPPHTPGGGTPPRPPASGPPPPGGAPPRPPAGGPPPAGGAPPPPGGAPPPPPAGGFTPSFVVVAHTQQEEDEYHYWLHRRDIKETGLIASIAHIVKGALGGGILGGHVAYMKAGVWVAVPLNIMFGIYMGYCLHLLVMSAQTLYKRTKTPSMSYPDVGEAAMCCFPIPWVSRLSKPFRYLIDTLTCLDLFGACACYQIIIAKSLKQMVENRQTTTIEGLPGYPNLRIYLIAMCIPIICVCLIRHLKNLSYLSIAANIVILFCIAMAVYYAFYFNPSFSNLVSHTKFYNSLEFVGMIVFSMSCAGVVVPIENKMRDPSKFNYALIVGMSLIVLCTFMVSFFGYVGFTENCESPITVNFPMTLMPKLLKVCIVIMIYVTHAINFWVPFDLCFHYIKKKLNHEKLVMWEYIFRAIFVSLVTLTAVIFPNINALMGFLGAFCLSNMAFIWPNIINLLVIWERPGLGKMRWRLWRSVVLIVIGLFILVCGSIVNASELLSVFV